MRYRLKAAFMGEVIEDVYCYGKMLAKSPKEAILVIERESDEHFKGGIVAAAAHAQALCDDVTVLSDRTIRKTRLLESGHKRKVFEVYDKPVIYDMPLAPRHFELCAVIDYGHGMMTAERIDYARQISAFLAVNVQVNAGNYGFNLATKYENLDYLCVDELEARLATQNRDRPIEQSLEDLSMLARIVVITLGKGGAVGFDSVGGVRFGAARTKNVVDTMGAGDAFFAASALAAASGATLSEILRVGNAAGAAKCKILGHSRAIKAEDLDD